MVRCSRAMCVVIALGCTKLARWSVPTLTMGFKQSILERELFIQALRHMGKDGRNNLYWMLVERLNSLFQNKNTLKLEQFPFNASPHRSTFGVLLSGLTRFSARPAALQFDARHLARPLLRDECVTRSRRAVRSSQGKYQRRHPAPYRKALEPNFS